MTNMENPTPHIENPPDGNWITGRNFGSENRWKVKAVIAFSTMNWHDYEESAVHLHQVVSLKLQQQFRA